MLDLSHKILLKEVEEIAHRNMTVERCKNTMVILIGGYRHYFYESHEDADHDYEIIERYVRLQNID